MSKIATDLGLHREFTSGPGFEHAARQHPTSGRSGGNSFNGNGRRKPKGQSAANGGPRTYSARPSRNRRRRRRG